MNNRISKHYTNLLKKNMKNKIVIKAISLKSIKERTLRHLGEQLIFFEMIRQNKNV